MAKSKYKRISERSLFIPNCSDFEYEVDGAIVRPHAGESLELAPLITIKQRNVLVDVMSGNREDSELLTDVWQFLKETVIGWSWTRWDGKPIPPPGEMESLDDFTSIMSAPEMFYIIQKYMIARRESVDEEKKES